MLERIREGSQGVWAKVVLGLVILSFALAGVGSYITSSTETDAAVVNGDSIPLGTFERAYQSERQRMESQLGEMFSQLASNADYLQNFRSGILQRLISDKVLEQTAADLGLRVSDQQVKDAILNMPEFKVGGQFNNERYVRLLQQAGFQTHEFRDYMRAELTRRQISTALLSSDFALEKEVAQQTALQRQTRDVRYVKVAPSLFDGDVAISDEERQQYYQDNIAAYDTEEQVKVAYVELKSEDLKGKVDVDDADIQEYYEQNLDSYRTDEQRRASHILLEVDGNESEMQAKADELREQLLAGADFAELAKANSSDTFSAENGGDLDFFGRDVMAPEFEEATFALANVGDISEVVKTEFGFHIIKLTDVKAEEVQAFEAVKEEIRDTVQAEKAGELFYNIQEQMATVAFEVPETLAEVAAAADKEVVTTELFSRSNAPEALSSTIALENAFSETLIAEQVNSDVLELGSEHIIVMRVEEHQPQRTQPLEEVQAQVDTALKADKAKQAAADWANELLTALRDSGDISEALAGKALEWAEAKDLGRNGSVLSSKVAGELFKLSDSNKLVVVEDFNGDAVLVELQAINQGTEVADSELTTAKLRLAQSIGQGVYGVTIEALKEAADVEILAQ